MGLQIRRAGLGCYIVPVTEFEHKWGTSHGRDDELINYFGRKIQMADIRAANRKEFRKKWKGIYPELF